MKNKVTHLSVTQLGSKWWCKPQGNFAMRYDGPGYILSNID